jgi:hypothetical protein
MAGASLQAVVDDAGPVETKGKKGKRGGMAGASLQAVVDDAGPATKAPVQTPPGPEKTYIMVKPDGVQRGQVGDIIARFEEKGFRLCALQLQAASTNLLEVSIGLCTLSACYGACR